MNDRSITEFMVHKAGEPLPQAPAAPAYTDTTVQTSLNEVAVVVPQHERPPAAPAAAPYRDARRQTTLI